MTGDDLPKLVRDRIPAIIRGDGADPVTEQVPDADVQDYLADKLLEEAAEFRESGDVAELADVLEVLQRLCQVEGMDWAELEERRQAKREDRGGFDDNIVLRDIED
ncbi:MAG: hypothetical protein ABEI97_05375 [Candidatus Nanohaloarchaea archaeon]